MRLVACFLIALCACSALALSEETTGTGLLEINVTDILGHDIASRVELQQTEGETFRIIEVPDGRVQAKIEPGKYKAYVSMYVDSVPVLIDVKSIAVKAGQTEFVLTELLEGTSGHRTIFEYDKDHDFAIDSAELAAGTDPADAASIPGREAIPMDDQVFSKEARWYRGELHAFSHHSIGKESVSELIKRAEKLKLDFLAITDRNTVAACYDKDYKSKSVVLIPAMEWGDDKRGVSLIYGPRTFTPFVDNMAQAQALVGLVQAQGGFYAAAHPCFPTSPWQWALSYINGVQVWCRDWNGVPPVSLDQLDENVKVRDKDRKLVHSLAFAAASATAGKPLGANAPLLSANGQAAVFYDSELVRGLKAAAIGGSHTASPDVPMGEPLTYVYATEKSVKGILDGMRKGRTYISSGPSGPKMLFYADVLKDGSVDVSIGGVVPVGVPLMFEVVVEGAQPGDQVQILVNGHPAISKNIEGKGRTFVVRLEHQTESYAVYRARVTRGIKKNGVVSVETIAMTSPIYAQLLDLPNPKLLDYKVQQQRKKKDEPQEIVLPDPSVGEIKPQWQF